MGQQQLLLIVLGVIIVGIAVVVGINVFTSSSASSSRDLVISQLTNLGAKAQQYYRKPQALGGGENDFKGFGVDLASAKNAAGEFVATSTEPTDATAITGDSTSVAASAQTVYIVGMGKETGTNGTNKVKAYVTITKDNIVAKTLN
jgi:uncharacterized protein (UPF0333 family)